MIRVLLVEDHQLMREGLRLMLEGAEDISVVGQAGAAEEAMGILEGTACDMAIVDVELPGKNGIWLIGAIKQQYPTVPVLMLSMDRKDRTVVEALDAGASGYVVKNATQQELLDAVRLVHGGGSYVHPTLMGSIVTELRNRRVNSGPRGGLTEREQEILGLSARGLTVRDIAERISVSENTVKSHLSSLYRKLDVSDRTQAVMCALREGLITLDG